MRCTRSPACVRVFLLARLISGLGDRGRYPPGGNLKRKPISGIRFRTSLRGLLIVILVSAAYLSWTLHQAQRRTNAISELRLGGALVNAHSYVPWPLTYLGDFKWGSMNSIFDYPKTVSVVCMVDDEGNITVGDEQLNFEATLERLHQQYELAKTFAVEKVKVVVCRGSPHNELEARLLDAASEQFDFVETNHRIFYLRDWAYQRDWENDRKQKVD